MAARDLSDAHWRDSARRPRFFMIDAFAAFPLLIFLLHIRLWTFLLALIIIIFLGILERFKFTLPVFFRFIRSFLAGPHRTTYPSWRE